MPSRGRAGPRQRVLVVNDDGIDAPGLRAVVVALAKSFDVYVCAPAVEKSASSHAINIHAPISAEPRFVPGAARAFACGGGATPADCAMLALDVLFADDKDKRAFDVVVSGVNRGENCGRHVVYSGTVAAAREAAMRADAVGVAVSLDSYKRDACYDHAAALCARIVETILLGEDEGATLRALRGKVLNVNVPAETETYDSKNVKSKDAMIPLRATAVGASCTRARWVAVPDPSDPSARGGTEDGLDRKRVVSDMTRDTADASSKKARKSHSEAKQAKKNVHLDATRLDANDAAVPLNEWQAGTRWFRNRPGSIAKDGTVGTDRCALDAGFVSVSVLEAADVWTRSDATTFARAEDIASFFRGLGADGAMIITRTLTHVLSNESAAM
jgi:5'-nucleotidase